MLWLAWCWDLSKPYISDEWARSHEDIGFDPRILDPMLNHPSLSDRWIVSSGGSKRPSFHESMIGGVHYSSDLCDEDILNSELNVLGSQDPNLWCPKFLDDI